MLLLKINDLITDTLQAAKIGGHWLERGEPENRTNVILRYTSNDRHTEIEVERTSERGRGKEGIR